MPLFLYRVGFWLFSPFLFLWVLAESLVEGRKAWQRLGLGLPKGDKQKRIWLHASSVGEVNVIALLLPHLQNAFPGTEVALSVFTNAGRKRAESIFENRGIKVFHPPLDFWGVVEGAFGRLDPSILIITETELWPELLATAAKKQIPVFLANGTLSQKSAKRYGWVKKIFQPGFLAFQKLLVQTGRDKTLFVNLGIPAEKIEAVGQTKYDLLWNSDDVRPPVELERFFYWAAGSTRPGEEEKVLAAHRLLVEKFPNLKLLLAPRHLNRLEEIEGIVRNSGFGLKRASRNPDCQTPVILLDQMGALLPAYAGAQAAFVGGTLVSVGGHNLLEPPSVGTPVIFGPSVENVKEAAELLAQTEITRSASTPEELARAVVHFLELKLPRPEVKRKAQAAFSALGGVSQKTAEIIRKTAGNF